MAAAIQKVRYELGLNWSRDAGDLFTSHVAQAARLRRIRWLCVPNGQADRVRRRVERGQLEVGLFLNTQADGLNPNSPGMLLCRSLKAASCLVVEDPDDARVYADRAVQMRYLERAGVSVPRHVVVEGWHRDKRALTAAQRTKLGPAWTAQPAVGMGRSRTLTTSSRAVAAALARAGFAPGQKVLLCRHHRPVLAGDRELRFLVWYLFGHIVPCWWRRGARCCDLMTSEDLASGRFVVLASLVSRIAEITGLDWFVTELIATKARSEPRMMVLEPANALAGLGPGLRPLRQVPADVIRTAADRIVEVAWRHAHRLPLSTGKTVRTAS